MSENLQQVFNDFVRNTKAELDLVDQRYPAGDDLKEECLKYIEKLNIYKKFTEDLIKNGFKYIDVIAHLSEELSKSDPDITSTASTATDETIFEDFLFLRKCVDKRVGLDEEAMRALVHLEGVVEKLVADKQKLLAANDEVKVKKNDPKDDENIAPSAIETLTKENEELKQIIKRNEEVMKLVSTPPSNNETTSDVVKDELSDCLEKLKELQHQLKDKEEAINHLTKQLAVDPKSNDDPSEKPNSISSESKESFASQSDSPIQPRRHQRSRSDVNKSTSSSDNGSDHGSDSRSLTDNEKRDNEKLRLFKGAYKELAKILKEKYQQLREQRTKIAELSDQLKDSQDKDKQIMELLDLNVNLKEKVDDLTEDLVKKQEEVKTVDELKQKSKNLQSEIEKMKERESLLGRKLSMHDENLEGFLDEREYLIKISNEMMDSIAVCKKELEKFNTKM